MLHTVPFNVKMDVGELEPGSEANGRHKERYRHVVAECDVGSCPDNQKPVRHADVNGKAVVLHYFGSKRKAHEYGSCPFVEPGVLLEDKQGYEEL